MLHEGVVLLGSTFRQGLEPVCVVCDAHLQGPLLHAGSYCVGYRAVQAGTVIHHVNHLVVDVFRQVFVHLLTIEHILAKILRRTFVGHFHVECTFLERFFYYLKSQIVCHII